jgi:hypothetical protein
MNQYEIPCHIFISKVSNHQELKPKILNAISSMNVGGYIDNNQHITKTDWNLGQNSNKPYFDIVKEVIKEHLDTFIRLAKFESYRTSNIWFQYYEKGDYHGIHVHSGSMYSNVYYVQLDKNSPKTTFTSYNQTFEVEVEEGDIITFPSFLKHESKPNMIDLPKVSIAFNVDTEISPTLLPQIK